MTGATGSTWTFNQTQIGTYNVYLNVTDSQNQIAQSNTAKIIVNNPPKNPPTVSIAPATVSISVGATQQFTSTVTGGSTPYMYQWYYGNGTAIAGATTSTFSYKATVVGTLSIYLNVTDSGGLKGQSNVANITIKQSTITLTGIRVTSFGSGYTNPTVTLVGGGGSGATATAHIFFGMIYSITLTNPGSGYTSPPTVVITDPSTKARGAAATVTYR